MADFKGGFRFNNGSAAAEVEQNADGSLVSCRNPITGESIGGSGDFTLIPAGAVTFNAMWFDKTAPLEDRFYSIKYAAYGPAYDEDGAPECLYIWGFELTEDETSYTNEVPILLYKGRAIVDVTAKFGGYEMVGDNIEGDFQYITGPGTVSFIQTP